MNSTLHNPPLVFIPVTLPTDDNDTKLISKRPKLIISCPAGFGIESERKRICGKHVIFCKNFDHLLTYFIYSSVACPKNTFSEADEAYCKPCRIGEYQPIVGSKSCIPCNSPIDDTLCLRVLVYIFSKLKFDV